MSAEQTLVLPHREPQDQSEEAILQVLTTIYAPHSSVSSEVVDDNKKEWMDRWFATDVVFSGPKGEVWVGHSGLIKLQEQATIAAATTTTTTMGRKLQHRLLVTPETLPVGSMVIDQVISSASSSEGFEVAAAGQEGTQTMRRSLIVLKRRQEDGKVIQWTEEEGHRRVSTFHLTMRVDQKRSDLWPLATEQGDADQRKSSTLSLHLAALSSLDSGHRSSSRPSRLRHQLPLSHGPDDEPLHFQAQLGQEEALLWQSST